MIIKQKSKEELCFLSITTAATRQDKEGRFIDNIGLTAMAWN
jgi:hypothetical protein